MISERVLKSLEFDKILNKIQSFAILDGTKQAILKITPDTDFDAVKNNLTLTNEANILLYKHNLPHVYYFSEFESEFLRAKKGGVLSLAELLKVAHLLKSSFIAKSSIDNVKDESIIKFKRYSFLLFIDVDFQNELFNKIISEDQLSDNASPELKRIRKKIIDTHERIKNQLNAHVKNDSDFLQDKIVTVRNGRYVIPVKAEYKNNIKGIIHDQSASGATVFIEPEHIVRLNNELSQLIAEEKAEVYKIMAELSSVVGSISDKLEENTKILHEIDCIFAKAVYCFKNKCRLPELNKNGVIDIIRGRHPLIQVEKIVPVTVKLGQNYNYLLITGPNTGGKTVTLKLTGLLTIMAMSGLFIPAGEGSQISVFDNVFCDVGDEQSIEQSLSTFSSHVKNIIEITDKVDNRSLVLIDEIGAGTDPEEGASLALAVINYLLDAGSFGIITTHYTRLKEFAMTEKRIENASMDFNPETYAPLYKLNIGIAGSSNAIEISKRLGINPLISKLATSFLSDTKISFENVLREAEKSRQNAEKLSNELDIIEHKKRDELYAIQREREVLQEENAKLKEKAHLKAKKIIDDKTEQADEIIEELQKLLKKDVVNISDVISARSMKKQIADAMYDNEYSDIIDSELIKPNISSLKEGNVVFLKSLSSMATIKRIKNNKNEIDVLVGNINITTDINDIFLRQIEQPKKKNKYVRNSNGYSVKRTNQLQYPEINILGQTVLEGIESVEQFIAQSVTNGYDEVKIIHGIGTGALRKAVVDTLKRNKFVLEFRFGMYGEGQQGVTIVKLKK